MNNPDIIQAMQFPWTKEIRPCESGGYMLTVFPPLADFELYAETEAELEEAWRDALESHLTGYLACGKVIPIPHVRVFQEQPTRGDSKGSQRFSVSKDVTEPLEC